MAYDGEVMDETTHDVLLALALVGLVLVPVLCAAQFAAALFSDRLRDRIREKRVSYTIWVVVSVLFTCSIIWVDALVVDRAAPRDPTSKVIEAVEMGIFLYSTEHGQFPAGTDNAKIIRVLTGENQGKKVYLYLVPEDLDAKGEVVDSWGTPLRINRLDSKHPQVQSAGPDRQWDTGDDIYNEESFR
jgi:hypothetical protein